MVSKPKLDKNGHVLPLKKPALVRFRNKFKAGNAVYEPFRFGVQVPAGVVLPKSAEILEENYEGPDLDPGEPAPEPDDGAPEPEGDESPKISL